MRILSGASSLTLNIAQPLVKEILVNMQFRFPITFWTRYKLQAIPPLYICFATAENTDHACFSFHCSDSLCLPLLLRGYRHKTVGLSSCKLNTQFITFNSNHYSVSFDRALFFCEGDGDCYLSSRLYKIYIIRD